MKRERENLDAATVPPNGKTVHLCLSVYLVISFSLRPKTIIYVGRGYLFRPDIFRNASQEICAAPRNYVFNARPESQYIYSSIIFN